MENLKVGDKVRVVVRLEEDGLKSAVGLTGVVDKLYPSERWPVSVTLDLEALEAETGERESAGDYPEIFKAEELELIKEEGK